MEGPSFWLWIINPLLLRLEEEAGKYDGLFPIVEGRTVPVVAFADDLAIVSYSLEGASLIMTLVHEFCSLMGLKLSLGKCVVVPNSLLYSQFEVYMAQLPMFQHVDY